MKLNRDLLLVSLSLSYFCAYYRAYELSFYIYQYYQSNGMELTVNIINSLMSPLLGYSYSYATDGVKLKKFFDNVPFVSIGEHKT